MDESMKLLEELVKDKERLAEVFSGSDEEILSKLEQNGIVIAVDELNAIKDGMASNTDSDELEASDLDSVAGGCKRCYDFFYKIGQIVDKALNTIFGKK